MSCGGERQPRYPELQVSVRSSNPLVLVAGVREELRRVGADRDEIDGFTEDALASPHDLDHVLEVARHWIGSAQVS
jgi:hypothetical protein